MAVITKSIGTSSRDYSTITLWEADLDNGAEYAASDDAVGECYADSDFDEVSAVTINGGGTIGLSSVHLTVASGERHDGTAGTGVRMTQGSSDNYIKFNLSPAASVGSNLRISWLEIDVNGGGGAAFNVNGAFTRVPTIDHTLCHDATSTGGVHTAGMVAASSRDCRVHNNIFYNLTRDSSAQIAMLFLDSDLANGGCLNNTVYNVQNGSTGDGDGIVIVTNSASNNNVQNNISVGNKTNDFSIPAANAGIGYNLSSDATGDDGGGAGEIINVTVADQFVSTVGGSEDLRLKSGADAIGAGFDLGTTPTDVNFDIAGRNRDAEGDVWDIGAHQFVSAGGPSAIAGNATVSFTSAGNLKATGALAASASVVFAAAGNISANSPISASPLLAFSASGELKGQARLEASSNLAFTTAGALSAIGRLEAAAGLAFNASGNVAGASSVAGTATVSFSSVGELKATGKLESAVSLALTASGAIQDASSPISPIAGSAALSIVSTGALRATGRLSAASGLVITASGGLIARQVISINASVSLAIAASGTVVDANNIITTSGLNYAIPENRFHYKV